MRGYGRGTSDFFCLGRILGAFAVYIKIKSLRFEVEAIAWEKRRGR